MEKKGRSLIAVMSQKKTKSLKFRDIHDAAPH